MTTGEAIDGSVDRFPARSGPRRGATPSTVSPVDDVVAHEPRAEPDVRPHTFLPGSGVVKVCGLREPVHAAAAAAAGADLLGFIFAPARRQVTPDIARACGEAAREEAGDRRVLTVGVFVDASAEEMNAAAEVAGLDLLQLHGQEAPEVLELLARPVVKAVRPPSGTRSEEVRALAQRYRAGSVPVVAFLLDGYDPTAAGGEGISADWRLAGALAADLPLFLAGGLTPDNVTDAIAAVGPLAVDVSSGVETEGVKDVAKIAAFVRAAKRAFAERV